MRKPFWIALLAVAAMYFLRVPPEREEPQAQPPAASVTRPPATAQMLEPAKPVRLTVLTGLGAETTLTIDRNTEVLVVATWCPYTRRLDSALKDARTKRFLRGKRLVYLLAWNELDLKATAWVRDGRITRAQADELVASQSPGPRLVDRDFVRTAATSHLYYFDADHAVRFDGYPSAFSGPPNEFLKNYGVWFTGLGVPRELKAALWAAYPVEGG